MLDLKNRALMKTVAAFHSLAGVRSVRLEASSVCQLKCPKCPTGSGANRRGVIGSGFLSFDNFKRFVDSHPKIRLIELSNYGEIFLNPELYGILEYAHQKGVHITALNGVNLNDIEPDVLEALVRYKVKGLTLSIDGASDAVYRMYRKNGNLDRVLDNFAKINLYKKKYRSRWPVLRWQFVVFDHNRHELQRAKEMAKNMKALFFAKPCWDEPVGEKDGGLQQERGSTVAEKQPLLLYCSQFWYQPQVNWDGKLLGCCVNHFIDFGNVFDEGLNMLMSSDRYKRTRQILEGEVGADADSPCYYCPIYQKMYTKR